MKKRLSKTEMDLVLEKIEKKYGKKVDLNNIKDKLFYLKKAEVEELLEYEKPRPFVKGIESLYDNLLYAEKNNKRNSNSRENPYS
jgi:hypothetical protein